MDYFVDKNSIVRKIWGNSDIILLIFAGAAAEFALNKAVDWLYFTGKLPSNPMDRLFTTVNYARLIVFSKRNKALTAIKSISAIHENVEKQRGSKIPDWAYRDVLFMLIDYSIRAFQLLERPLTNKEKLEVFETFNLMGKNMGLTGLPYNFKQWQVMRQTHLENNLLKSHFTEDLFKQYAKQLGWFRFKILLNVQQAILPARVRSLMFKTGNFILPVIKAYKFSRFLKLNLLVKKLILPPKYLKQIMYLDIP